MSTTPEGYAKRRLRKLLDDMPDLYHFWPVQMGFGETTLDVLGCYRGRFFSVETKAPKKKPTLRQENTIKTIEQSMGKVFVIIGEASPVFDELQQWLDELSQEPNDPHFTRPHVARRAV